MPYSIKLPTGEVLGNIPDNVSQEDAFNLATNYMKDETTVASEAAVGFKQGADYLKRSFKDTLPEYFFRAIGDNEAAARQEAQGEERKQAAAEDPSRFSPFQTTDDVRNVSDALKFGSRVASQGVVSSLPAIGAAAGTVALGGAPIVAGGAAYLATSPLSLTEVSDTFKEAGIRPEDHGMAFAATSAFNNLLEFAPETGAMLRAASGPVKKQVLRRFLEGALRTGTEEAATSVAQEGTTQGVVSNIKDTPFLTEDNIKGAYEAAIQGFIGGTATGGLIGLIPQATPKDAKEPEVKKQDNAPVTPSDVLSTEEVEVPVADEPTVPVQETVTTEVKSETPELTPEEAFSKLFEAQNKKTKAAPKEAALDETVKPNYISKSPIVPVVKTTETSVPLPVELNPSAPKISKTPQKLAPEVTKAMKDAENKVKTDYLASNGIPLASKLNKVQRAELKAQQDQARNDVAKSYLDGQMNQTVENMKPAVRARFDNAANAQQKTYVNMINDFADLVGLNMPVAVVFKNGDSTKLDNAPWDSLTRRKIDNVIGGLNSKTVGLGGIVDIGGQFGDRMIQPLAAIGIDTTSIKNTQDAIQVLAHELGHVIDFSMMKNNPELAKAVNEAWLKDVTPKAASGMKAKDYFLKNSSLSFTKTGEMVTPSTIFGRAPIEAGTRLSESGGGLGNYDNISDSEYRLSRNEWVAEQIARWFQTQEAPVSVVEKYFKWIADVYRRFFQSLKDQGFYPNDTINDIMNRFVINAKADVQVAKFEKGTREDALAALRLYHASPHTFNEFSTEKVDSGEGSQYEGWGLYFASIKDVAKWYHESFGKSSRAKDQFKAKTPFMDIDSTADISNYLTALPLEPAEKSALRVYLGLKFTWDGVAATKIPNKNQRALFERGQELFKKLGGTETYTKGLTPQLYKVDVDIDESKMIEWDKEVSDATIQSLNLEPEILTKVMDEANHFKNFYSGTQKFTGKEFYYTIANHFRETQGLSGANAVFNAQKQASLYLNQLGIPGIKYLDSDSRSTEAGTPSHNYVIFNDGAIKIQEMFDDGDAFMESGAARRKPDTKVIQPSKKEAKDLYKAQFTPDAITHEQALGSLTGETEGTFTATDSKNRTMGSLSYVRELVDGKLQTTMTEMKLEGKSPRARQDTAFALLNQLHKDATVNDNIQVVDTMKPYKDAYDRLVGPRVTSPETKTKDERPAPKLSDVRKVPVFEKNTLPKTPQVVQNFFKKLPNAWVNQTPVVSSVLTRDSSRVPEGKQAYKYPEAFGLTADNKATLTAERNNIAKFVSDTYFQGSDLQHVKSLTTSDLIGHAYDAYIEAKAQGKLKFESNLTNPVISVFDKLDNNANDIKLGLNGTGVTKTSDVYYIPTTFNPVDIDGMIQDSVYEMERQDNLSNVEKQKTYDDVRKIKVGPGKISGPLTGVLSWINPVTNAAKNSPFIGFVQDIAIARRDYGFRLQSKLMHMLEPVLKKHGETTFNALVGVLESNRLNNFKGRVDEDGNFIYKDSAGKLRKVTNKQQTESIMQLRGIFNSILKERRRVDLAHRSTQDLLRKAGLGLNPSVAQIDSTVKNNDKKLTEAQVDSLKNLSRYLKQLDDLENGRDYVPFTRSGNTGITIKAKNPETGKTETVAFVTFNKNRRGNVVKDAEWNNAQEVLAKYQGDSTYEISDAFDLTKDALLSKLTNKEVTLDILDQLIDIMMKNGQRIDDEQANAVPSWEAIGKLLRDDISKKGYDASMKHAQNIDGYRKNWYNILPNHIQGNSYSLSNRRYTPALRYALRQGENVTQEEKVYAERYVNSLLNPDSDLFQNLRSIQFNWVLGFRPASALLQLTSLTHMMPATLTLMTNSPVKAYSTMMRAFKESNHFAMLTRDSFYDITPETIASAAKKYGWSEDKQKAVYRAYQDGYLTQTLTFEEVGATPYDTSTWQGKLRKGSEDFTRLGGMLLRSTEELSRLTQFLSMYDALNNPNNLARFHELVKKDDAQYRAHLQLTNADGPDGQYLLRYGLNNSLALFGKEGRTPFQSTPLQFALPFATYPWQMFMNFYRMARKMGPEGRKAAITASIGIISTAGIWGLPGFMLLKEGLEAILSLVFEEDIDLDKEVDELGQEMFANTVNPWLTPEQAKQMTGIFRRGLPSTYSAIDLNERVGFQTLGEQQLIGIKDAIMTGEAPKNLASDMYGVVGGTVAMAPLQALNKYRESGGSWIEAVNQLLPQFMKDAIQSNIIEPEKGKSFAGTQTLSAQDADTFRNRLLGSTGFKSREEGLREELARSVTTAEKRLGVYKDSYARKVERFTKDLVNAPEGTEAEARERFNEAISDYVNYLSSKNVPGNVIMSSVQRVIKDAQSEALGSRDYDLSHFFKMKQVAKEARDEIQRIHELYELEE